MGHAVINTVIPKLLVSVGVECVLVHRSPIVGYGVAEFGKLYELPTVEVIQFLHMFFLCSTSSFLVSDPCSRSQTALGRAVSNWLAEGLQDGGALIPGQGLDVFILAEPFHDASVGQIETLGRRLVTERAFRVNQSAFLVGELLEMLLASLDFLDLVLVPLGFSLVNQVVLCQPVADVTSGPAETLAVFGLFFEHRVDDQEPLIPLADSLLALLFELFLESLELFRSELGQVDAAIIGGFGRGRCGFGSFSCSHIILLSFSVLRLCSWRSSPGRSGPSALDRPTFAIVSRKSQVNNAKNGLNRCMARGIVGKGEKLGSEPWELRPLIVVTVLVKV
jgi:hypothetical protein